MEALPAWSDAYWLEKSDGPWRRGLRLLQGWWRATHTDLGPGNIKRRDKPVVSMLPEGVGLEPNLMTVEARDAANTAMDRMKITKQRGIIEPNRLRRNLLSSQPLCFNLFGHLGAHAEALLPWVHHHAPRAAAVSRVELEWAPLPKALGGSAFDAFIEYTRDDGAAGFLGIECKYAEKLSESQQTEATPKYRDVTRPPRWSGKAVDVLDQHGLRQLWYNQIHTQAVAELPDYVEGFGLVVACAADQDARDAVERVRGVLSAPDDLRFSSLEDVVDSVAGHDDWRRGFATRYLDLTPILDLLPRSDPRRQGA
jgi:hypothetical protein